jgi:hypothetical protein
MIGDGDDSMADATGDDAMDNATVEVDEVLDKILDNAIEAYGSSARDVYGVLPGWRRKLRHLCVVRPDV